MRRVKLIGLTLLFGVLSVAVTVAGFFIGAIFVVLTPFLAVFTGLWGVWFITKDYDDAKQPGKSKPLD